MNATADADVVAAALELLGYDDAERVRIATALGYFRSPKERLASWMLLGMERDLRRIPYGLKRRLLAKATSCYYCHRPFDGIRRPVIDHVIPVKAGGAGVERNLVVACDVCNSIKSDQRPYRCGRCARWTFRAPAPGNRRLPMCGCHQVRQAERRIRRHCELLLAIGESHLDAAGVGRKRGARRRPGVTR